MLLPCIVAIAIGNVVCKDKPQIVSVLLNGSTGLTIKNERVDGAVVWATFENAINTEGWSYLEVRSNPKYSDEITSYAAGVAEAALTNDLIKNHTANLLSRYCDNNTEYCDNLAKYQQNQLDWMNEQSKMNRQRSPFWNQVYLLLKQMAGIHDVLENFTLNTDNITTKTSSLYTLNTLGSLIDLETVFGRKKNEFDMFGTSPCSMLIKVTGNDVIVGHNAWTGFKMMLRIQKKYILNYGYSQNSPDSLRVPGHTISMSSYPGLLHSLDDFYVISTGLLVTETTNDIFNKALYKGLKPQTVPTGLRAMVANRITIDGRHWTRQFEKHNSGTYNNQWSVIDYKKISIVDGRIALANETFWMLEQLPTLVVSKDMTAILREQTYWSSYNIPYFPSIYEKSGVADQFKLHGDRYSHDDCPRGRIFRRDQFRAENTDTLLGLLRYNDYRNDPFSQCNCTPPFNPVYTIAARYDLLDPSGIYHEDDCKRRADGAIDAKVADSKSVMDYSFLSVSGPTNQQQPSFAWSKSGFGRPLGHPDVFDFEPIRHRWSL